MSDKPKRRWYQIEFSIRDLMWFTALVAILLTWWLDHSLALSQVTYFREQLYQEHRKVVRYEAMEIIRQTDALVEKRLASPISPAPAPNPPQD